MEPTMIIRGGVAVTDGTVWNTDITISEGIISSLSAPNHSAAPRAQTVDARDLLLLPGVIDPHVHFQLPFCGAVTADDFSSGSRAAAMGGVTTFIDFATPSPDEPMEASIDARLQQIEGMSHVDFALHGGITRWRPDTRRSISQAISRGIPTFKTFMTYRKERRMVSDATLFRCLEETGEHGGAILVHAENDSLISLLIRRAHKAGHLAPIYHGRSRPPVTEAEPIGRAIRLAAAAEGQLYIVHMSTVDGAETVRQGQVDGVQVAAETCPQYLLLNEQRFNQPDGHLFATCPPLRAEHHADGLWEALIDGTVSCIGTDHCNFTAQQKAVWDGDFTRIPYGMPGVETLLPLIYSYGVRENRISLPELVEILSGNPAKLFGLFPQKGTLRPGSDADIVFFDPDASWTVNKQELATPGDWYPYAGFLVQGRIRHVLQRGRWLVRDGQFVGGLIRGQFLPRQLESGVGWE